jgi:hypothetical protein
MFRLFAVFLAFIANAALFMALYSAFAGNITSSL